jgi:hypothetical protein
LLAVVAVGWGISTSYGHYSLEALVLVLIGLVLALAACLRGDRLFAVRPTLPSTILVRTLQFATLLFLARGIFGSDAVAIAVGLAITGGWVIVQRGTRPGSAFTACAIAAAILLSGHAVLSSQVIYGPTAGGRAPFLLFAAGLGFVLNLCWVFDATGEGPTRTFRARLFLLFAGGALLRIGAIQASPDPMIDVYTLLHEGPGFLLQGQNPYSAHYSSPYEGDLADSQPAGYPPLPYLVALPFRMSGLDVRYANVVCDLAAALMLFFAARSRGSVVLGAVLSGLYLNLPRVPFMMEQAWYEPMLAACLGAGLLLAERGRSGGFLLLGLGLTGKQFGLPLLLPTLSAFRHRWWMAVYGVAAGALLVVPFLIWDAGAFLEIVLLKHLGRGAKLDSITLYAGVYWCSGETIVLPRWLLLAVMAGLVGWISWKTPPGRLEGALWIGATLFVFCFLHSQGYFNYYYLVCYLLLLGVAGLPIIGESPASNPNTSASPPGPPD